MYVRVGGGTIFYWESANQNKQSQSFDLIFGRCYAFGPIVYFDAKVWLQQTGTDFTQTGSTTPSIISGTFLVISYNIVKYIV